MKTIRQQLTRRLLWTVGLLFMVSGVVAYFCARGALIAQFDAALNAKAQAITTLTEEKKQRLEIEFSDEHMRGFDTGGRDFFELWQADGQSVEHSPSLRKEHLSLRQDLAGQSVFWDLTLPDGQLGRAVGMKFNPQNSEDDTEKPGSLDAILIVASLRSDLDHTLAVLSWVLAGGGLFSLVATALLVPRVLKCELLPLHQLADETSRIDAASLSARFSTTGLPGELNPIAMRLNELLARLENSFERERQFSSDVAHEFRTPVAELRSLAELAIKLPDTRTAATDHEMLAIALQLESILTHLLMLSWGERSSLDIKTDHVSLGSLTHKVCENFQEKAANRQVRLICHPAEEVIAETDPMLFRTILSSLVDNAVEYAPRDSVIGVEIRAEAGERFMLRVSNTVQDLEAADLPHLFKRFWRKDTARTTNGHAGLGLPLAKAFAAAIGCELSAIFIGPKRLALTLTSIEN